MFKEQYPWKNLLDFIDDPEKYFLDISKPTKNELVLYQLYNDMSRETGNKFERIFAKILKG